MLIGHLRVALLFWGSALVVVQDAFALYIEPNGQATLCGLSRRRLDYNAHHTDKECYNLGVYLYTRKKYTLCVSLSVLTCWQWHIVNTRCMCSQYARICQRGVTMAFG